MDLFINYSTTEDPSPINSVIVDHDTVRHLNHSPYLDGESSNLTYFPVYTCHNMTSFNEYFHYCTLEIEIINRLKLYSLPVFVIIGGVGNTIAFAALTRKHMLQTSMSFYLAALMVIHTVVLFMGCGLEWLSYITEMNHIAHFADWSCKLFSFSFNVVRYAAWWVLLSMTVDCYLRMWCPGRSQYMCTLFVSQFLTVAIFVMLVSLHVHAMWTYELMHGMTCNLDIQRQDFETVVWPWISAILSNYLPILLITMSAVMLTVGLVCSSSHRPEQSSHTEQLTRVTLALAMFFLCHALPTITMNFIDLSRPSWQTNQSIEDWDHYAKYLLIQVVFSTVEGLYSSTSFVILFALLPALRKECCGLFQCACCLKHVQHEELNSVLETRRQLLWNRESKIEPEVTRV